MSKIYFFTGEETYLTHKELLKRKKNFSEKYGPENVLQLSLPEYSVNAIIEQMTNTGLFSNEKLLIIQGIPGETTSPGGTTEFEEKIIQMRGSINPDYFIIFVSSKPDKRKKAYKFFSDPKHCQVKIFEHLTGPALIKHIEQEMYEYLDETHKDTKLDKDSINILIERTQSNLWLINGECQKLSYSVSSGKTLNYDNVSSIITGQAQDTMFGLMDAIVMQNKNINSIIHNIRHEGKAIQEMIGGILRGLKIIISYAKIMQYDHDGLSLASILGVPPFTLAKYKSYKDSIKEHANDFLGLYNNILEFDFELKSGNSDEIAFWPLLTTALQQHKLIK